MSRRPVILIALILLLIGGAAAFFFHLWNQAPPKFSEVDDFLRGSPASTGWHLIYADADNITYPNVKPFWFDYLGISRNKQFTEHTYWFTRTRDNQVDNGYLSVMCHGSRIEKATINFPISTRETIKHLLLGEFPRLLPKLGGNP